MEYRVLRIVIPLSYQQKLWKITTTGQHRKSTHNQLLNHSISTYKTSAFKKQNGNTKTTFMIYRNSKASPSI